MLVTDLHEMNYQLDLRVVNVTFCVRRFSSIRGTWTSNQRRNCWLISTTLFSLQSIWKSVDAILRWVSSASSRYFQWPLDSCHRNPAVNQRCLHVLATFCSYIWVLDERCSYIKSLSSIKLCPSNAKGDASFYIPLDLLTSWMWLHQ